MITVIEKVIFLTSGIKEKLIVLPNPDLLHHHMQNQLKLRSIQLKPPPPPP